MTAEEKHQLYDFFGLFHRFYPMLIDQFLYCAEGIPIFFELGYGFSDRG